MIDSKIQSASKTLHGHMALIQLKLYNHCSNLTNMFYTLISVGSYHYIKDLLSSLQFECLE